MKIKSLLFAAVAGAIMFVFIPYIMMRLNDFFSLPLLHILFLKILGLILIIAAAILFSYCSGFFSFIGRGTPIPIEPPKKLVVKGIYRYSRNPIYVSYFLIILGEFFMLGHILLLFYLLAFIIIVNLFIRFYEEPVLEKRFGKSYNNYRKNVPRWFFK